MGLFKKKTDPALSDPDTAELPVTPPPGAPPMPPPVSGKPGKQPKPPKRGKFSIDPVDFLHLRAELQEVKARLEASEHARAMVENRLSALDATAVNLASGQSELQQMTAKLDELEAKVTAGRVRSPRSSQHIDGDETEGDEYDDQGEDYGEPTGDPELAAKVAALEEQLAKADPTPKIAVLASQLATLTARLDAPTQEASRPLLPLPPQVGGEPDAKTLDQLQALRDRIDELDTKLANATPANGEHAGNGEAAADEETAQRLDALQERVTMIDQLTAQLSQLNARVSAQAEFGAQLSALRDRISHLQEIAASADAMREQVNQLARQADDTPELGAQLAQLAERVSANDNAARQAVEHTDAMDQRLASLQAELVQRLQETDQKASAAHEQVLATHELAASADAKVAAAQEAAAAAAASIADTVSRIDETAARIDGTEQRLNETAAKMAETEHLVSVAHERLDVAHEKLGHTEHQFAATYERITAAEHAAAEAHEKAVAAQDGIASAHEGLATAHQALAAAHSRIDANEAAVADARDGREQTAEEISALAQRMTNLSNELTARLSAIEEAGHHTNDQVSALDQRLSNVSTELANQISELGRDIDTLAEQPLAEADTGINDELVESLRTGQARLAAEQARYEIAFRQDLASLAEQVRKAGSGR